MQMTLPLRMSVASANERRGKKDEKEKSHLFVRWSVERPRLSSRLIPRRLEDTSITSTMASGPTDCVTAAAEAAANVPSRTGCFRASWPSCALRCAETRTPRAARARDCCARSAAPFAPPVTCAAACASATAFPAPAAATCAPLSSADAARRSNRSTRWSTRPRCPRASS
jgi:hypothetical protein